MSLDVTMHGDRRFRALIEHSTDAIALLSQEGTVTYASPSIERVLGYTPQEFMTINGFDVIHPGEVPALAHAFQQLLAIPGLVDTRQFRSRHKDGSWRWVEATLTNLVNDPDVQAIVMNLHEISERKQAEVKLEALAEHKDESLALLDSLFECAPVGFAFIDTAHRYVKINPYFADIHGISAREHLGKTIEELPPLSADTVVATLEQVFTTRMPAFDIEVTGETPRQPGVRRHWLTNFYPVCNSTQKVRYVGATMVEITQRKQTEASEQRFHQLADSAPVMIWTSGIDKLCTYFNAPWLAFTGRTIEQELGNGWAEGVHPADKQRCIDIYSSSFDARKPFSMDYRLRRFDGQYRWVLDNGIPFYTPDGTFTGYIGSCIDITERRQLEQQLQYSELKLRSLVESNILGVIVCDDGGRIYEINDRFTQLLGYRREELLAGTFRWHLLVPPDAQEAVGQLITTILSTGALAPLEWESLHKDGSRVPVLAAATLLDRERRLMLAVILDISDRKAAERRQQEFLSMVSHELRTPLTSIMGLIELAVMQIEHQSMSLPPEAEELLGQVEKMLKRASGQVEIETRLVEELLEVSRLEMHKFELSVQGENLVTIVEETVANQRQAARTREIELILTEETVPVLVDAGRIGQVLTNYLTNALKYSPVDSMVSVRLEVTGIVARVSVCDQGPGLTLEQQLRVWERFYQAAPGRQGAEGGLGLGLAIAKAIVEQHRGQVGVEIAPGRGSTFWFTLPLAGDGLLRA
jgi:PAS domain S-box-containing protein